jgi:Domain of unknown function (DUF5911)
LRIKDDGLIGDMPAGALVGRHGLVNWMGLPRFDLPSCFAALAAEDRHGRWQPAPADEVLVSARRYRPGTLMLESDFETSGGAVRVIDSMPRRGTRPPRPIRIVEGLRGRGSTRSEFALGPDYGSIIPWAEPMADGVILTAGPDAFGLSTPMSLQARDGVVTTQFVVAGGARDRFTLTWFSSHEDTPPQGEISGLSRSVSDLGSSLGSAIDGTILVSQLAAGNESYVLAMTSLVVVALIGLAAATLIPPDPLLSPVPSSRRPRTSSSRPRRTHDPRGNGQGSRRSPVSAERSHANGMTRRRQAVRRLTLSSEDWLRFGLCCV